MINASLMLWASRTRKGEKGGISPEFESRKQVRWPVSQLDFRENPDIMRIDRELSKADEMAKEFDKYSRFSVSELKNLGVDTLVRVSAKPSQIEGLSWDWAWICRQDEDVAAVLLLRETLDSNEDFVAEYFKEHIPEMFKDKEYLDLVDWEGAATIYGRVINQDPTIIIAHFVFPQVVQNLLDMKQVKLDNKVIIEKVSHIRKKDLDRRVSKIIELLRIKESKEEKNE